MADTINNGASGRAAALFNSGCNCAQAALCAFAKSTGLTEEQLMLVSSDFGGGISGTHLGQCGAVSGMLMALGLIKGYSDVTDAEHKQRLYAEGQELMAAFEEEFGSKICSVLKDEIAPGFADKPHPITEGMGECRPCTAFVAYAAKLLEEKLRNNG